MPRNREFDPDKTLRKAIELFWNKGYAETSMRDLVSYTEVAHAGLYSVFGGKRELFKAALEYYRDGPMTYLLRNLETPDSGRAEVEEFFLTMLQIIQSGDFKNGCFMVNTAIEFGDDSDGILQLVNTHMDRMISAFQGALQRAKEQGKVRDELDVLATAEYLLTVFNGIAIFARARTSYDRIERTIHIALKELG